MSESSATKPSFLVVVESDETADQTVEYALREARDLHAEFGETVVVDVRIIADRRSPSDSSQLREHMEENIFSFDFGRKADTTTGLLEPSGAGPEQVATSVLQYVDGQVVTHLIIDPNIEISVERLRESLGVTIVELAPTDGAPERRQLLHPGGLRRFGTIFGITYLFYLAIGGFVGGLDLLTGALSAGVVALSLSRVALSESPAIRRTGLRVVRMAVFLPVLLWEVAKANFVIAYIILHPRLPIDPSLGVIETDTTEGIERMVLANSITLTPGTLTVDVQGRNFTIHSLTAGGLSSLQEGRLQRLVGWVFRGNRGETSTTDSGGDDR